MSLLKISNGVAWVPIPDGAPIKVSNGIAWVTPQTIKVSNGFTWVTAWTRSDPITVSFFPTLATTLRWNGSFVEYDGPGTSPNNALADLFNGRFNGSYPYHYTNILHFNGNSIQGVGSLAALMGTRPVVKSASLRLHRVSGGYASPAGYLRIGTWTQPNAHTLPATTLNGTWHDWDPMTVNDVAGWGYGQNREFPVHSQQIYDMVAGKAIMFSEVISGYTTSGATTFAYMRIYGAAASDAAKLPVLTVTLDVV